MYYTTGFSRCEIEDLCALVAGVQSSVPPADRAGWPPILGLGNSVVIALTYLRRNRVQWELAETYGVSQSTISRAITAVTPLLARALARFVPGKHSRPALTCGFGVMAWRNARRTGSGGRAGIDGQVQAGVGSGGVHGRPSIASRRAAIMLWPCLAAVDR